MSTQALCTALGEMAFAAAWAARRARDACAGKKLTMLFILKPPDAMPCLPPMHENFRFLCLVAQRLRQPAVIFMRVRQDNSSNVGDAKPCAPQTFSESFDSLFRLRPGVNQRHRVFGNQIAVDRTDVEGRGNDDGNDFHKAKGKRKKAKVKQKPRFTFAFFLLPFAFISTCTCSL